MRTIVDLTRILRRLWGLAGAFSMSVVVVTLAEEEEEV